MNIQDFRDNRGKKYEISTIIILMIVGFAMGANNAVAISNILKCNEKALRKFIALPNGIPSHDTFTRIMKIISPKTLMYELCEWAYEVANVTKNSQLIIDGKGILAATKRCEKGNTPYIMNVLEAASKLIILQLRVGDKTNEIVGISELLDYLYVNGATITIDGIGTQKEIVKKIVEKDGNYVLPVKDNQKNLHENIRLFMEDQIQDPNVTLDSCSSIEKGHGRIEERIYTVSHDTSCIDNEGFSSVKTICKAQRVTTKEFLDKKTNEIVKEKSTQEVMYISNTSLSAIEIASHIRSHWLIENSLHWVLDHSFREDESTTRTGYGMENLSLLRKMAYNIVRLSKSNNDNTSFDEKRRELSYNIKLIFDIMSSTNLCM